MTSNSFFGHTDIITESRTDWQTDVEFEIVHYSTMLNWDILEIIQPFLHSLQNYRLYNCFFVKMYLQGVSVTYDSAHCFALSKWVNVVTNSHVQMANFAMAFYYYICHSQLWPVVLSCLIDDPILLCCYCT